MISNSHDLSSAAPARDGAAEATRPARSVSALAGCVTVEEVADRAAALAAESLPEATAWVALAPEAADPPSLPWRTRGAASSGPAVPLAIPSDDPLIVMLRARPSPCCYPAAGAPWAADLPAEAPLWVLPLVAGERLCGALVVQPAHRASAAAGPNIGLERLAFLDLIAAHAAVALDRVPSVDEAPARPAEGIAEMVCSVTATLDRQEVLSRAVAQARRLTPCDHVFLATVDEATGRLLVAAVDGGSDDGGPRAPIGLAVGERLSWPLSRDDVAFGGVAVGRAARDLEARNEAGFFGERMRSAGIRSFITSPITFGGAFIGELCLASSKAGAFSSAHAARLGELAPHVGVALHNAEMYAGLAASLRDLRSMQERLVRSERLRALGEMASGVAHDFNNVLNAILHHAALLATSSTEEGRWGLHRIEQAALRGAETVRRLQDFTRQRRDTDFVAVDLAQVIGEATRGTWGAAIEETAADGGTRPLRLEVTLDPDLPVVMGAHGELVEVISNLISNALDAMPDGGVLKIAARPDGDRSVIITVRDTGGGMDQATRERAFDPFFTSKGVRGTGLGLSVVYGLVERHGGEITLDSALGVGTTATVSLPARSGFVEVPTLRRIPPILPDRPLTQPARPSAPTRVLLIEDDDVNREATRALLEFAGFEVTEAATGTEGIARFRPDGFEIVLSDLGMPDCSGWEVARAVKQAAPTMPVALITGWGLTISEDEGVRRGVDLIIKKPVAPQRLLGALTELLARRACATVAG